MTGEGGGGEKPRREPRLPVCTRCEHYFVTWEPARPHGCREFGFRSKRLPALEILRNSGVRCGYFREKPRKP